MIVTNDEYETIVAMDLIGAKSVSEYLGLTVGTVRKYIHYGYWGHTNRYKAVIDEYGTELHAKDKILSQYEKSLRNVKYNRTNYLRRKARKNEK